MLSVWVKLFRWSHNLNPPGLDMQQQCFALVTCAFMCILSSGINVTAQLFLSLSLPYLSLSPFLRPTRCYPDAWNHFSNQDIPSGWVNITIFFYLTVVCVCVSVNELFNGIYLSANGCLGTGMIEAHIWWKILGVSGQNRPMIG